MQIWAVSVRFLGIFRLAYINQLYPREKKIGFKSLKKYKKSTIKTN